MRGINRSPVNTSHKWPVTRKMFPLDDIIMTSLCQKSPATRLFKSLDSKGNIKAAHYWLLVRRYWRYANHERYIYDKYITCCIKNTDDNFQSFMQTSNAQWWYICCSICSVRFIWYNYSCTQITFLSLQTCYTTMIVRALNDDVIKWKHFPR